MTPDEIKALRQELKCTARELAAALDLDQKDVLAWEAGDLFPTKRFVTQMEKLRRAGPDALPRTQRGKAKKVGLQRLDDPKLWEIVKKMCQHPALFEQVAKLSERFDEPPTP